MRGGIARAELDRASGMPQGVRETVLEGQGASPPRLGRRGARVGRGHILIERRPLLPLWFPRVNEIIRLLGSHNLLAAPTSAQLDDPSLRPLIDRFLRGAKDVTAEQRARIFRLAWDFVGSALASRGEQYERFYLASSGRAFIRAQTFASPDRARRLIDRFLSEELVPGA